MRDGELYYLDESGEPIKPKYVEAPLSEAFDGSSLDPAYAPFTVNAEGNVVPLQHKEIDLS